MKAQKPTRRAGGYLTAAVQRAGLKALGTEQPILSLETGEDS